MPSLIKQDIPLFVKLLETQGMKSISAFNHWHRHQKDYPNYKRLYTISMQAICEANAKLDFFFFGLPCICASHKIYEEQPILTELNVSLHQATSS